MEPRLFGGGCVALFGAAYFGFFSRDVSSYQIKNTLQGLALGLIFAVGKILIAHQGLSVQSLMAITLTPWAINRLAFLAQTQNYLSSDVRKAIEQNFTRWLDIIRVVSSTAMLILLSSQAKSIPLLEFGLAVLLVGVDYGCVLRDLINKKSFKTVKQ